MKNRSYSELLGVKVKVKVPKKSTQIVFTLVSCMCDNVSYLKLRKTDDKVSINLSNHHCALSLSNLQMKGDYSTDLEWACLDNNYDEVVRIINTGTSKVDSIKSR